METNPFYDESFQPNDKWLIEIFAETWKYWQAIRSQLNQDFGDVHEEWKFFYKKSGWLLQVTRKKRTIFWLRPFDGYFCITFWFGDKAAAVVENSDLPTTIKNALKNAKKYKIGRSIQIDVKQPGDVENIKKLMAIKVRN